MWAAEGIEPLHIVPDQQVNVTERAIRMTTRMVALVLHRTAIAIAAPGPAPAPAAASESA